MTSGRLAACRGTVRATLLAAAALSSTAAWSQAPDSNIGEGVRQSGEARRPQVPRTQPALVLPQVTEAPLVLNDRETLLVRRLVVEGPTLADSEAGVRAVLKPYEGRRLTLAQIHEAADKVTALYREQGYLLAKVYVPAQDARGGTLKLKLLLGQYGTVVVKGNGLVADASLQRIMESALASSPHIQRTGLERGMLLISDLPGAGLPRAVIARGKEPGTADVLFNVPDGKRIDGFMVGDNFGSAVTGEKRIAGLINVNSPLGIGDRLSAFGMASEDMGQWNGRVAYAFPIGRDGLRGEIAGFHTTYVLGGSFAGLDATGIAEGVSATLVYPLWRRQADSVYLTGNYTHKALQDEVLGATMSDRSTDSATAAVTRDTAGTLFGLPFLTGTTLSFTAGYLDIHDPIEKAINLDGIHTLGDFSKINLSFNAVLALSAQLSLSTSFRAQKSLSGNLDTSEQLGLTGAFGVRSFDEGLAGDTGYVFTPELKYALPEAFAYRHAIGLFTDLGAILVENPFAAGQRSRTQLSDVGLGYYATFEYRPGQFLLLKAQVARTFGSNDGAEVFDQETKGLLQIGFTY